MAKALSPVEKKRAAVLKEMTPKGQSLAKTFDRKIQTAAKGLVTIEYDMGAQLVDAGVHEAEYGSNIVEQLAAYLDFPGGATALYQLKNFALEFDRGTVVKEVAKTMTNGRPLRTGHFLQLVRLKSTKDQLAMLTRIRAECLSVNQLEEEIRARFERKNSRSGGRKPQKPSSPAAGLQKLFSGAQKLDNFLGICEENVFEPLEEAAPETIDEAVVDKFDKAQQQLESLLADGNKALERMKPVRARLGNVLKKKKTTTAEKKATPKKKAAPKKKPAAKKKPATKKAAAPKKKAAASKTARKRPSRV